MTKINATEMIETIVSTCANGNIDLSNGTVFNALAFDKLVVSAILLNGLWKIKKKIVRNDLEELLISEIGTVGEECVSSFVKEKMGCDISSSVSIPVPIYDDLSVMDVTNLITSVGIENGKLTSKNMGLVKNINKS